jgi:acyl carrier protein
MSGRLDTLHVVRDAVAIVCDVDGEGLTGATRFVDLGADSLARVSIADVVEAELARTGRATVHIDDALLGRMECLDDLADYLASLP